MAGMGGLGPSHQRHAELVSASIKPNKPLVYWEEWTLKQVQGDDDGMAKTGRFLPITTCVILTEVRIHSTLHPRESAEWIPDQACPEPVEGAGMTSVK
ncbi:hypothetical protein [Sphingobium yanoikuyae]|jgi:hypothetical protein|uniref:Uncharacterized protein n=1 Tax=Sphingobium yanoikuyae TaxID=13690 RepID=A0A9X7YE74_SPHYA|nr:hypothetical protein [Sphingobium yanoikuyae]QNG47801.1 hypothetical protein H3V42_09590 [Sphingobium yanoikuyae]